ncbi:hypothetical protein MJO28_014375 [Puccinia striiformis f. sp. tritici]|uniref:Uncharacterized protein n=1 Tax=Puccinia striiformis f. sp. tritici TaxID=168172 RepID=A0ACC0DUI1_9BASI|nr:hypothetical protein Pst134EA_026829 [Puccinia striiformis f. sp. tritici]KAI9616582.1 hypothetical protein H4Q26_010980 [Puccinia striiformis f. sp. tritici PST-130]KAH9450119.1 hypothetical protein Pst134EA_026829 [Puccinia striiformis f. sp. tritici]KAI7933459.1 hypothetical protein MJO28_017642 [Puccinia striiformis f. sp. tritici]KAI7938796.1 hypothetical protein MJO28_014375 [Puccinia striiformis f. sp. tritici]KAI7939508.1 hypothetical protein MJO29_014244 [Puccinia striiformis f. sp
MPHYALSKINANGSDESFHCRGLTEDEAYSSADRAGSMETIKGAYSPMYSLGEEPTTPSPSTRGKKPMQPPCVYYLPPPPIRPLRHAKSAANLNAGGAERRKTALRKASFPDRKLAKKHQLEVDGHPKNVSERDPPVERNADSPTRSKKPAGLSLQGITNFFRRSPKQPPSTPVGNYRLLESPPLTSSSSTDSDSTSQCGSTPTKPNTLKPINDNIHSSGNSKAMRRLAVCVGTSSKKPLGATDLL